MGKSFRKIITIVTALLFALPILLLAVSCKSEVEPRSEADVIPATLGTAEGLWLYNGNYRSRTDGTEKETLLKSVTVDGTEYGEDEFEIVSYKYVKSTCEIFYIIRIGEDVRICHYNYKTAESGDLYDLGEVRRPQNIDILVSDSLVYIDDDVIFSCNAELLYDRFSGTLDGDIVYTLVGEGEFTYIMNGEKHTAPLYDSFSDDQYHRYGNYVYILNEVGYAINLDTAEVTVLSAFATGTSDSMRRDNVDFYSVDGSSYVLSMCYPFSNIHPEYPYQLFRITGDSATLVYDFGVTSYNITMTVDGSTIYFTKGANRSIYFKYYSYDTKTGELESVSKSALKGSKTTKELQEEQKKKNNDRELTVTGYTFFVTSIGYDDEPDLFMGGTYYTKTCYYLMRKRGDKEEVMQYSLNENRGHFFDDICEF